MDIATIYQSLSQYKFCVTDEKTLQGEISQVLANLGIPHKREVRLSNRDIIDFMIEGMGIEIKIKGTANDIYRQCQRYCEHSKVQQLLLVTNRAMGFPSKINGKPCYVLHLGKSWL